jgi:hypothetical protein
MLEDTGTPVLRMDRLEDSGLQHRAIDLRRRIRGELWLGVLLNGSYMEEGKGNGANGLLRGQYSDAVLNELESQNDGQVEGIMGKVRQLKDVCALLFVLETVLMGNR